MIKVRNSGNIYVFLYQCFNSKIADVKGGWIYLDCDLDYFNSKIMNAKRYYDKKRMES